ncbi:HNH endonuclease signature motif containing protein [Methylorubrum extorquens]|nr:HNH endonuclease signature motif containing protein [Methylorubrum extorquens]MCP1545360.1 hypothetical protein [Methylorubrum extorquens]MCP1587293.1 hypothetical protein [Methylorubrum extorquens]
MTPAITPELRERAGKDRPIIFSAAERNRLCNADRVIKLPDAEIGHRYICGETIAELARHFRVSNPTIAKALSRLGIARRAPKPRPGRFSGSNNPAWTGGRRQRADGYWLVWTPEGERLEHRVAVEKDLGRRLADDEIVHHRDGDKSNNDPSNLQVMCQREHARHHAPEMHAARYGHGR